MQGISPAIRYFGMDRARTVLFARTLCDGEPRLKAAIKLRG
jgi:hypothetical protein